MPRLGRLVVCAGLVACARRHGAAPGDAPAAIADAPVAHPADAPSATGTPPAAEASEGSSGSVGNGGGRRAADASVALTGDGSAPPLGLVALMEDVAPSGPSRPGDGGGPTPAGPCRVVRGPIELPVRGAVALQARGGGIEAVINADGVARRVLFPAGRVDVRAGALSARESSSEPVRAGLSVPCALADPTAFCPDRSGGVHRTTPGGDPDRLVASSRSGTRVAATSLSGGHRALSYVASRQTTEGWVSEAWLAVDDRAPSRISEDGSGATSVALGVERNSMVALTVDARAALTALHVRVLSFDGELRLGEDQVVFVGGPGDRRTAATLALVPSGPSWALLPTAKDVGDFGLAVVRLDDPPRVDEPVRWSMYPNGLDPAPVASVTVPSSNGRARLWVARVRPDAPQPGAMRIVELGEIDPAGTFLPAGVAASSAAPLDIALAADAEGALWLAWLDATGAWLERLVCGPTADPGRARLPPPAR